MFNIILTESVQFITLSELSMFTLLVFQRQILFCLLSLHSECLLLVHVGEHEADVGGEQVVHLVAQGGLAEQLGAPHQVPDGHVEVGVAAGPVGDPGEGVGHQHVLNSHD